MTTIADGHNQAGLSFRPRLRDEIVFGPPQRVGASTVYYLKDRFTNWFYRIGVREHFLMSRMDGSKSLEALNEEYMATFGRRLNEYSWAGLFQLMEKRQMLANTADSARLEDLKQAAAQKKREENSGLLRRRFPLVSPDTFLDALLPWFRFAFRRSFVIPVLLCIVALEVFVGFNVRAIAADAWASRENIAGIVVFIALVWLFAAAHETAHGLACKNFGGSVSEMGLLWRYLSIFPYCKLDDVMLFHNRWHRVYAAFAGIFVNLLSIIPFAFLWLLTPAHSMVRTVSALMLLSFNASTFLNFIPFIELDGYFMLNHILGMVDLRKEANQFWLKGLLKLLLKRGEGNVGYTRRDRAIYLTYGFFSFAFTACFLGIMAFYWFTLVRHFLGDVVAYGVLLVFALALLYRGPGKTWVDNTLHVKQWLDTPRFNFSILKRIDPPSGPPTS